MKYVFLNQNLEMCGFLPGTVAKIHLPMQETWVAILGWEQFPEKEMATHSSILSWEIPCTEEPGLAKESNMTQQLKYTYVLKVIFWQETVN